MALKRRGVAQPLSLALALPGSEQGRAQLEGYLAAQPYPHFELVPDRPGLLVKIDQDGTRTVGRFVRRVFTPVEK